MKMRKSFFKEIPANATDLKSSQLGKFDSKSSSEEDEDDLISNLIGDSGKWQLKMCFLLSLFNVPCTWHMIIQTFQTVPIKHWCARPSHLKDLDPVRWQNLTQLMRNNSTCMILNYKWSNLDVNDFYSNIIYEKLSNVSSMVKCHQWEWDGPRTLQSEWDMICDKEHWNSMAETTFLAGVALGGIISGMISDHYGRKRTLFASVLIQTVMGTAIAYAPSLEVYLCLRAILGFVSVSVVFSGFVLSIEIVGGYWRASAGIAYMFPVPLSSILLSGIAWYFRDWKELQLVASLPGFLFLFIFLVIPESPRWLLAVGQKSQVLEIISEAAAYNNRKLPDNIDKLLQDNSNKNLIDNNSNASIKGVLKLFKTKEILRNTFFLLIIWFVVYLIYYGIVLNMGNIGGDLYINTVLSGIVEVPALAISILILRGMSCRLTFFFTLFASGIACFLTIFVPCDDEKDDLQWVKTTLVMIGKFSISSSNALMPIFTAELYPTVIRNLGVGINNVPAGCALMLIPSLWKLNIVKALHPIVVLGISGFIGGICILFLPETGVHVQAKSITEKQKTNTLNGTPDIVISSPKQEETFTLDASLDNSLADTKYQSHHI